MYTLLMGYNVASSERERPEAVGSFLRKAAQMHAELQVPCTLFVRGETLGEHPADFAQARDTLGELCDFQQATYSGTPLKTVCQENHTGVQVFPGGSLSEIRDDVARASDLMRRILGESPIGLAGPLGYFRGLSDRPDILGALQELGIRFTRTYARNARDWVPVAFEVQPFRYEPQGFGDILEIPGQGWVDSLLKDALGYTPYDPYVRHVKKDLDYVAARELVWSCVQQDWSCVEGDPEMGATRAILEYARDLGFTFRTHKAFHEEMSAAGG